MISHQTTSRVSRLLAWTGGLTTDSVKVLVGLKFGDVKLGQHCSALSVPYKQCRGSKNSPGAPGQDSLSEAIQQTEGGKKDDVSPPPDSTVQQASSRVTRSLTR